METSAIVTEKLLETIESLRREVAQLNERVAAVEANLGSGKGAAAVLKESGGKHERLSEELVLTISAAIAAYLGVKPHIRHIRVLGSTSWGQQGRATLQASHSLNVHHS